MASVIENKFNYFFIITYNLGMCPDEGLNLWHFALWEDM